MKKIEYNRLEYYSLTKEYGFPFEENNRQFALSINTNSVHIHDLYTGGRVLWFQLNDLLPL